MKKPERHPGGPRGAAATGVRPYIVYLMPEQVKRVDALQHKLGIRTRAEMVRTLIEKGLEQSDWWIKARDRRGE